MQFLCSDCLALKFEVLAAKINFAKDQFISD